MITSKQEKLAVLEKERQARLAKMAEERALTVLTGPIKTVSAVQYLPEPTFIPAASEVSYPSKITPMNMSIEALQEELYKRKQELVEKAVNMTLDADHYRVNIPSIKLILEDKTPVERAEFIGNIAVITGVPIIIVACYVGEIYGFTSELDQMIQRLMSFYTIKEVLNVKRS